MVVGTIKPGKLQDAIKLRRAEVLPSARKQMGFKGVRFLADRGANKVVTMGLWESEAAFYPTATALY
jgi:heme-degrading monooxygenase HmoA